MKQLFPPEIMDFSLESHFRRHHTTSRLIYLLVLLSITGLLASTPFIKVDITRQGKGIIRSKHEDNPLAFAISGKIAKIHIRENLPVHKGDTLVVLDTGALHEKRQFLQSQKADITRYLSDLDHALSGNRRQLQTLLITRQYARFAEKQKEYEIKVNKARKTYKLNQNLYDKQFIPRVEFEQYKYEYDLLLKEQKYYRESQHNEWSEQWERYHIQVKELNSQMEQLDKEKEQYLLTAPINGTITRFSGLQEGNFIVPNQSVAQISPDKELLAECFVPPADIGLIKKGMDVKVQLDAFPHNQWGLASGKVIEISNNIVTINNQPYFKVRTSVNEKHLQLKNSYKGEIIKGMTFNARFVITRRSLFQLLFDKMDDWLNPHSTA